jgi:hypothetical protein
MRVAAAVAIVAAAASYVALRRPTSATAPTLAAPSDPAILSASLALVASSTPSVSHTSETTSAPAVPAEPTAGPAPVPACAD